MRCEKPQCLALLQRVIEVDASFHASFAIPILFPFAPPARILPETELWKFLSDQLAENPFDEAFPKCGAEYVMVGRAYTPGGLPCDSADVCVRVGELAKRVSIRAGRDANDPDKAGPFASQRLSDRAADDGGDVLSRRPPGDRVETAPRTFTSLPVSDFAPLSAAVRSRRAGRFDRAWVEASFPGMPPDFAWESFNVSPTDQRQGAAFRGDEALRFENLHAARSILEGRLPGVRARCFIERSAARGRLEEVPLALDTLWLFPNAGHGVLVFHGLTPVREDDADDLALVLLACEPSDQQRSLDHYQAALARRLDPEQGRLAALDDDDLAPAPLSPPPAAGEPAPGREAQRRRMQRRVDRLRDQARADRAALTTSIPAPESPPPLKEGSADRDPAQKPHARPPQTSVGRALQLEDLPRRLRLALADVDWLEARAQETRAREVARLQEVCTAVGFAWSDVAAPAQAGPPRFSAAGQLEELEQLARECRSRGVDASLVERYLADSALRDRLVLAEQGLREAYRTTAHRAPPSAAASPERRARLRGLVESALRHGLPMQGWDLTGADLRGLSLVGAQLAGAWLEGAELAACDLTACDLTDAVLARADLSDAILRGASLRRANLGGARLVNARLGRAGDAEVLDATDAIFALADLSGADLRGARLKGADLARAKLRGACFAQVDAVDFNFIACDLSQVSFEAADLTRSNFLHAQLDGANFRRARLSQVSWLDCHGRGVTFAGADLRRAVFALSCRLDAPDFCDSDLSRANARGQSLPGALFTGARLDRADLSGCDLKAAVFRTASCIEARFERAQLADADLTSANLRGASFQKAQLHGARFRASNLFRSDFARAQLGAADAFEGALIQRAKFLPRAAR